RPSGRGRMQASPQKRRSSSDGRTVRKCNSCLERMDERTAERPRPAASERASSMPSVFRTRGGIWAYHCSHPLAIREGWHFLLKSEPNANRGFGTATLYGLLQVVAC